MEVQQRVNMNRTAMVAKIMKMMRAAWPSLIRRKMSSVYPAATEIGGRTFLTVSPRYSRGLVENPKSGLP